MSKFSQQKHQFKGLWGSLAVRVILVSLTFLVVPLFIDGVIGFVHDYNEERSDLFLSIKVLGAGRARIIDQFNQLEYRLLDLTLTLMGQNPEEAEEGSKNQLLTKLKMDQGMAAIFYLERQNRSDWVCTQSSNPI